MIISWISDANSFDRDNQTSARSNSERYQTQPVLKQIENPDVFEVCQPEDEGLL